MKKLNKRAVLNIVLCGMLVFCVGFYSSAQPTTAWFHDEGQLNNQYQMEELKVEFADSNGDIIDEDYMRLDLNFKTTAKLSDLQTLETEADLAESARTLEYAAEYFTFSAKNLGNLAAHVQITALDGNTQDGVTTAALEDSGLRYFIYEITDEQTANVTDETVVTIVHESSAHGYRAVYADESGNCLFKHSEAYYQSQLADILQGKIADTTSDLTEHQEQIDFVNSSIDITSTHIDAQQKKTFCVCFWVDHSAYSASQKSDGVSTVSFNVDIRLDAVQHPDSYAQSGNSSEQS